LKLLKNEIAEVEHLRRNLQGILLNVMKKQPQIESLKEQLVIENQELKAKLEQQGNVCFLFSSFSFPFPFSKLVANYKASHY